MDSIEAAFESLEEASSWAGRTIDPVRQMKQDLDRTSSEVLHQVQAAHKASELSEQRVLAEVARSEATTAARLAATEKVVGDLAADVKAQLAALTKHLRKREEEKEEEEKNKSRLLSAIAEDEADEADAAPPTPERDMIGNLLAGIMKSPVNTPAPISTLAPHVQSQPDFDLPPSPATHARSQSVSGLSPSIRVIGSAKPPSYEAPSKNRSISLTSPVVRKN
jgi:hypothetical protein